ncbi:ATP-binding protein [Nocardia sp. R16R-3T]
MTDRVLWPQVEAALLERDHELRLLDDAFAEAAGGQGRLITVDGPMGIGRTRLLGEAERASRARGFTVLRARGSELERCMPFKLAADLFEPCVRVDFPVGGDSLWRGPAALAQPLFTPTGAAPDQSTVLHGLYWLMVNLTERGPVAVLIDDVHWADQGSLKYLHRLADRLDDLPAALVVTIRTGDPDADSGLVQRFWRSVGRRSLTLRELSADAVAQMLGDMPDAGEPDRPSAELIWRETHGNPFFVSEALIAIHSGRNDRWLASSTSDSVRRHVTMRLEHLGDEAADFARAASILADDPSLAVVARVAGLDYTTAAVCAERLTGAAITVSSDPVRFRHRMLRRAIAASFGPGQRPLTHARAAAVLYGTGTVPEVIAHHLLEAPPSDQAWTRGVLHDAARVAARHGAPTTAVTYLRRAIDGASLIDIDPNLLVSLGIYEAAAGETTSLRRFEQALRMIDDDEARAEALYSLGQTQYRYGRYAEAAATFRRGAELFHESQHEIRSRFQAAELCSSYYLAPEHRPDTAALNLIHLPAPVTAELSPGDRVLLAVRAMHALFTIPPVTNGSTLARVALGDGALLREQSADGLAINMAILALLYAGELSEALTAANSVVDDARTRGTTLAYAEASLVRALIYYARGDITEAAADAEAAISGMKYGWHSLAPTALATLVHCLIERGENVEAHAVLHQHEADLAPPEASGINAWFYVARGRLRLLSDDLDGAARDLDSADDALRSYMIANPAMLPWRSLAGVIAQRRGDNARARLLIDTEIDLARQFDVPIQLGVALRHRAQLDPTSDRAIRRLQESVAVLTPTGASLELARALLDLGSAQRRAGQRTLARTQLRRALDLAHQGGAYATEAHAHEELVASGARPRRTASSGVESLTPTEMRIATLAAAGHSNRRIAELVFVSRNTASWHLRNIYRKLDIESREALSAALTAADHLSSSRPDNARDCPGSD